MSKTSTEWQNKRFDDVLGVKRHLKHQQNGKINDLMMFWALKGIKNINRMAKSTI